MLYHLAVYMCGMFPHYDVILYPKKILRFNNLQPSADETRECNNDVINLILLYILGYIYSTYVSFHGTQVAFLSCFCTE